MIQTTNVTKRSLELPLEFNPNENPSMQPIPENGRSHRRTVGIDDYSGYFGY